MGVALPEFEADEVREEVLEVELESLLMWSSFGRCLLLLLFGNRDLNFPPFFFLVGVSQTVTECLLLEVVGLSPYMARSLATEN